MRQRVIANLLASESELANLGAHFGSSEIGFWEVLGRFLGDLGGLENLPKTLKIAKNPTFQAKNPLFALKKAILGGPKTPRDFPGYFPIFASKKWLFQGKKWFFRLKSGFFRYFQRFSRFRTILSSLRGDSQSARKSIFDGETDLFWAPDLGGFSLTHGLNYLVSQSSKNVPKTEVPKSAPKHRSPSEIRHLSLCSKTGFTQSENMTATKK